MKNLVLRPVLSAFAWMAIPLFAGAADFSRDVQPVFARQCYECHGAEKQKGKLRLDDRNVAFNSKAIVPGKAAESELYRRIILPKGHDDIMPNRGEPLSKAETDLIRDWINEGAVWPENTVAAKHWSYVSPVRPQLPKIRNSNRAKNPIDHFILAKLEKENLKFSPEAERARLLRRVYLDLIGLPPSPDDVQKFLADQSPDAYERVVDRLLASPQYGVRWARPWLDLARYADSNGFQRDNLWDIWPYRDWVINAMNRDMPFDQFTIEQLAGDLLPNATLEQKIATGFNRCAPVNVEAGSDQEESRVNQIFDRVNTVGTVWLGSTIECAQCHNHKYDPISQKEYYQLFAFFNNTVQETKFNSKAMIGLDFTGPYLELPDKKSEAKRAYIQEQLNKADEKIKAASDKLLPEQTAWEEKILGELATLGQSHALEVADFTAESGSPYKTLPDKSILLVADDNAAPPQTDTYTITVQTKLTGITGFRLDVLTDPSLPGNGPGRGDDKRPNFVLNNFVVKVADSTKKSSAQPVKLRNPRASFGQKNFGIAGAIDDNPRSGWAINPQFFKDHWAVFETTAPIGFAGGTTFTFTLDQNNGGGRTIGRLRISALTGDPDMDGVPADIVTILQTPSAQRTKPQARRLDNFFLGKHPQLAEMKSARAKLADELRRLQPPQTLLMQELEEPRMSSMFVRGNFLEKGEPVQADVPAVLHEVSGEERNRLTLARWLVSTNNPLVARVTVNRWWAEFFGHGLVTTSEDFGIKGDLPTHPELLDWLATEFMEPGVEQASSRDSEPPSRRMPSEPAGWKPALQPWSMKHIHRLIVTSATYRQSSSITPELFERDDQNKLYARGPRFRMDAEMIRDNALSAAGLLSQKLGGPPVKPYQPPGIWESKVGGVRVTYETSEGEDQYRRGIYTVWKRTSPYPSFITFDAPSRNACTVKRPRSNTPLQALTLLNDPVYVEAAGALAKRVLKEKSVASVEEKIRRAFEICLSRAPKDSEVKTLLRLYEGQLQSSRKDNAATKKLVAAISKPEGIDAAEFAAWYSIASALLNLDETITKG